MPRPEPICARTLQPGSADMVRRSRRYATQQTAVQIPRGAGESDLPMKTKTHFAFRIDTWDDAGNSVVEQLAGLEDYSMAVAAYEVAVTTRPTDKITLRQGAGVVRKNWNG